MDDKILIAGAHIVNEGLVFEGSVLVEKDRISKIIRQDEDPPISGFRDIPVIDARGKFLIPGVIDDQVHFRDPGLTYKGDLFTESRAAVAGGITSFMDMPNTDPKTVTLDLLEKKFELASRKSLANYSFFLGATNDNLAELEKADPGKICGIKVFMGASTGNMLVDDPDTLSAIFKQSKLIIAIHSEDEGIIRHNLNAFMKQYEEKIPVTSHPYIRSEEACYKSTLKAVDLARKYGTRLHILHLSTARELELLDNPGMLKDKKITAEVCIQHLWFDERDYAALGSKIKWNPAIKKESDKNALFQALLDDRVDIIATDHAPHTLEEKQQPYLTCPSGGPMVQHSLVAMLEFFHRGKISMEKIVEKIFLFFHRQQLYFPQKGLDILYPHFELAFGFFQ